MLISAAGENFEDFRAEMANFMSKWGTLVVYGKTKVVGNRELSRPPHSNSALLNGKGVQLTQASKRPQLASYVWGCSYGPWRSLRVAAPVERQEW